MTFQQYRQKHGIKQKSNTISDGTKFDGKNVWKLKFREKKLLESKMFWKPRILETKMIWKFQIFLENKIEIVLKTKGKIVAVFNCFRFKL